MAYLEKLDCILVVLRKIGLISEGIGNNLFIFDHCVFSSCDTSKYLQRLTLAHKCCIELFSVCALFLLRALMSCDYPDSDDRMAMVTQV